MMPLPVSQAFGANQYLIEIFANIGKLCPLIAGIFFTKVGGGWQVANKLKRATKMVGLFCYISLHVESDQRT